MILIWRGYGFLAPAVAIAGFVAFILLGPYIPLSPHVAGIILCAICAVALWRLGKRLNDPLRDRILLDSRTGQTVRLIDRHDFFWIKLEYWAALPALLAAKILFQWLTGLL